MVSVLAFNARNDGMEAACGLLVCGNKCLCSPFTVMCIAWHKIGGGGRL